MYFKIFSSFLVRTFNRVHLVYILERLINIHEDMPVIPNSWQRCTHSKRDKQPGMQTKKPHHTLKTNEHVNLLNIKGQRRRQIIRDALFSQ